MNKYFSTIALIAFYCLNAAQQNKLTLASLQECAEKNATSGTIGKISGYFPKVFTSVPSKLTGVNFGTIECFTTQDEYRQEYFLETNQCKEGYQVISVRHYMPRCWLLGKKTFTYTMGYVDNQKIALSNVRYVNKREVAKDIMVLSMGTGALIAAVRYLYSNFR